MTKQAAIREALTIFNPVDASYWTDDGLPLLEAVQHLTGDQSITRQDITAAAPGFSRTTPTVAPVVEAAAGDHTTATVAMIQPVTVMPPTAPIAAPTATVTTDVESPLSEKIQTLQTRLTELRNKIADYEGSIATLKTDVATLTIVEEELDRQLEALRPVNKTQLDIAAYLASRTKDLQVRAERLTQIRKSGVDLNAIMGQLTAPVDAAMRRQTGYGKARPAVPLLNK